MTPTSPPLLFSSISPSQTHTLSFPCLASLSKPISFFLTFMYNHIKEGCQLHLWRHAGLEGTQRVSKHRDPGQWGAILRHRQRRIARGSEVSRGPLPSIWQKTTLPQRVNPVLRMPRPQWRRSRWWWMVTSRKVAGAQWRYGLLLQMVVYLSSVIT